MVTCAMPLAYLILFCLFFSPQIIFYNEHIIFKLFYCGNICVYIYIYIKQNFWFIYIYIFFFLTVQFSCIKYICTYIVVKLSPSSISRTFFVFPTLYPLKTNFPFLPSSLWEQAFCCLSQT